MTWSMFSCESIATTELGRHLIVVLFGLVQGWMMMVRMTINPAGSTSGEDFFIFGKLWGED